MPKTYKEITVRTKGYSFSEYLSTLSKYVERAKEKKEPKRPIALGEAIRDKIETYINR